jgi:uncharacterized membrane-anchored protein
MKAKLLIAVIALQAAWVVSTATRQELLLRRGTVVLLETVPVDPRDLLRGDYVILSYKISVLPAALFAEPLMTPVLIGTPVFVRLEKRGQFHEAVAASLSPLEPDAAHPVLRGTVSNASWVGVFGGRVDSIRVDYGLERYYVREGTGRPSGKITVEAAVTASDNSIIREVYIDGKPFAEVMRNQGR